MKKILLFTSIILVSILVFNLGKNLFSEPVENLASQSSDKTEGMDSPQTNVESNPFSNGTNDVTDEANAESGNHNNVSDAGKTEASLTAEQWMSFDDAKDYRYSTDALTEAMRGLQNLKELSNNNANISEESVQAVWQSVDAAIAENTITPIEGIRHKQWLSTLADSPSLVQKLELDAKQVAEQLKAYAEAARDAQANDPKFIEYKAEEERLTQEILAKYPNDSVKAAAELDAALNEVRTQIYK